MGGNERLILEAAWLPQDQVKRLPVAQMVAKTLCDRHNSALSTLDASSSLVSHYLQQLPEPLNPAIVVHPEAVRPRNIHVFHGEMVERWLLKVFVALMAGKVMRPEMPLPRNWTPPPGWLDILFGRRPVPRGWGLFLQTRGGTLDGYVGEVFVGTSQFWVRAVSHDPSRQLVGATFQIGVMQLLLVLADSTSQQLEGVGGEVVHRPSWLRFPGVAADDFVGLSWGERLSGPKLNLTIRGER